jgi:hypothetical protein
LDCLADILTKAALPDLELTGTRQLMANWHCVPFTPRGRRSRP